MSIVSTLDKSSISPPVAAFLSGAISSVLTVAATLVSLRSGASQQAMFQILAWVMYISSSLTVLILAWIVADTLRSRIRDLRRIADLQAHMPRLVRVRRRTDKYTIAPNGDAVVRFECELERETSAPVHRLTFPVSAGVPQDSPPWASFDVRQVTVDGIDHNTDKLFVPLSRKQPHSHRNTPFENLVVEEGAVRIPVSLDHSKRSCRFVLEVAMPKSMLNIRGEEYCVADISLVTDEINVIVHGSGNLDVNYSHEADYRVRASQLSGEIIDTVESQLQSRGCQPGKGVFWRSTNTKLGYRYEIRITGDQRTDEIQAESAQ